MTLTPEQQALSMNRKQIKARLTEAKIVLTDALRRHFQNPKFDEKTKRLIGDNGYALEWRVRTHPDLPISYDNQQTNRGAVVVISPRPERKRKLQDAA